MNPVKFDILVYKARDFSRTLQFFNDDGTPMDFTGCTLVGKILRGFYDRMAPNSMVVTSPALGEVKIEIPAATADNLHATLNVYEVTITFPNLKVHNLVFGNILVYPNVV